MRELVNAVDSHVELVDLEITNNLDALPHSTPSSNPDPATQPTEDVQTEPATNTVPHQLDDPAI